MGLVTEEDIIPTPSGHREVDHFGTTFRTRIR